MANPAENTLSEVLAAYAFAGEVVGAARFGQGHINDTFCVYTQTAEGDCVRYILQRMSAAAFKHPDQLMQNIVGVTDYLRDLIEKNGGDAARETMTVLRTKNGAAYFTDSEGGAWRVYPFVENTLCLQKAETPELFYASAKAFGIIPPIPCSRPLKNSTTLKTASPILKRRWLRTGWAARRTARRRSRS